MPLRRSHVRSSKPWSGPRGCSTVTTADTIAPCGGARPGGSSSSAGSCTSTLAEAPHDDRDAHAVAARAAAGAVTSSRARSAVPTDAGEDAAVERGEADAAPPPAGARERGGEARSRRCAD